MASEIPQSLLDQYAEDAATAPSEDALKRAVALAEQLREVEAELEELGEQTKRAAERKRRLEEEDLPALLDEVGVEELKLPTGEPLSVVDVLRPPSMGANGQYREKMIAWLEENDLGDLVKDEVKALFGKGETEEAAALVAYLDEQRRPAERFRTVAFNTLASNLKRIREDGDVVIPYDDLGIHVGRVAKLGKAK